MSKFMQGVLWYLLGFFELGLLLYLVLDPPRPLPPPAMVGVIFALLLAGAVLMGLRGNRLLKVEESRVPMPRPGQLTPERAIEIMNEVGPPGLGAEMERGRARAEQRRRAQIASTLFAEGELPMRLRAQGWSDHDAAHLVLMQIQGYHFYGDGMTLPSGRRATAEEIHRAIGPPAY